MIYLSIYQNLKSSGWLQSGQQIKSNQLFTSYLVDGEEDYKKECRSSIVKHPSPVDHVLKNRGLVHLTIVPTQRFRVHKNYTSR